LKWEHTGVLSCYFALTSYILAVLANMLAHIDRILHADRLRLSASDLVERIDEVMIDSSKSISITLTLHSSFSFKGITLHFTISHPDTFN
jgi:hypothetical protein